MKYNGVLITVLVILAIIAVLIFIVSNLDVSVK